MYIFWLIYIFAFAGHWLSALMIVNGWVSLSSLSSSCCKFTLPDLLTQRWLDASYALSLSGSG